MVVVLGILFREDLRKVLDRLKSWKGFGQELELEQQLAALNATTQAITAEIPALPGLGAQDASEDRSGEVDRVQRILSTASTSPKAALLMLSADIEQELCDLIATMDLLPELGHVFTVPSAIALLDRRGALPKHVASSLQLFETARNQLIHGGAVSDDAFAAIDSGIIILRALLSIPHETHVVDQPHVELHADDHQQHRKGLLYSSLASHKRACYTDQLSPIVAVNPRRFVGIGLSWMNGD